MLFLQWQQFGVQKVARFIKYWYFVFLLGQKQIMCLDSNLSLTYLQAIFTILYNWLYLSKCYSLDGHFPKWPISSALNSIKTPLLQRDHHLFTFYVEVTAINVYM